MLSFTLLLGHASGSHLFLILVAIFSLIFLGLRPIVLPVLTTLFAWGAFVAAAKVLPRGPSDIPMSINESEAWFPGANFSCTEAGEVETRGAGRVGVWRLDRELERSTRCSCRPRARKRRPSRT